MGIYIKDLETGLPKNISGGTNLGMVEAITDLEIDAILAS